MTHHHGALNSKNGIPRCARCGGSMHPLPLGYFQICSACRQFTRREAEYGVAAIEAWLAAEHP
jgi:hypothetical protein